VVAVAFPRPDRWGPPAATDPRPAWEARPARPAQEAGPGRLPASVYRRRRVAALLLVVVVAVTALVALRAVLGGLGGGPLTATGPPAPSLFDTVAARTRVVQPGDTLWSIARDGGVTGDLRPVVDRLAAARHGRPLQVGERITLP
jgi:hypothetical protein